MEFSQHEGIAPVGLHPVARLDRNERRRDDHAVMPEFGELPMQTIAARACLVAEMKLAPVAAKLLGEPADVIGAVRDRAPVRNSPRRLSLPAMATEIVALWTSSPTNMVFCMRSLPHS